MSNNNTSSNTVGISLGSLILRILGEIRAMAATNPEGAPAPSAIVTARAVLASNSSSEEEGNNTRHVIIFLGGSSTGMFGSASLGDFASSEGDFEHILARLAQLHQPQGPPPATKAALDALPQIAVDEAALAESPQCPICCERFCLGTEVCKLPCQHFFDRVCVMEWLTKHNTCPICRYELPVEDAEREQSRKERMAARGIDEDAFFAAYPKDRKESTHSPKKRSPAKRKRKERDSANSDDAADIATTTTTSTTEGAPEVRHAKRRRRTEEFSKEKEKRQEKEDNAERKEKKRKNDLQNEVIPEQKKDKSSGKEKKGKKEAKKARTALVREDVMQKEDDVACFRNAQESSSREKEAREPKRRQRRWAKRTKHEAA